MVAVLAGPLHVGVGVFSNLLSTPSPSLLMVFFTCLTTYWDVSQKLSLLGKQMLNTCPSQPSWSLGEGRGLPGAICRALPWERKGGQVAAQPLWLQL